MSVTLDGQNLFGQQNPKIEQGSIGRDAIERTVPGLDGMLSIDMGGRSRKIKQTGTLLAASRTQMDDRISAITAYIDGDTHTLVIGGERFENVRMDSFKISQEKASGSGLCCNYEITYTQLVI